ncbi:MAG: tetratricopeptide repeat protein [Bdellovibrionales bacterium]|nr:tetratricopeptide repeat protein [Bdellovibrionales bacterium]
MSRLESDTSSPILHHTESIFEDRAAAGPEVEKPMRAYPAHRSVEAIAAFEAESRVEGVGKSNAPQEAELLNNAKILLDAGEFRLAQSLLRRVLANNSRQRLAVKWMGDALRGEGHLEEAARCYSELLKIEETTEHHLRMAHLLYHMGEDQEALNHYYLALDGLPGEAPELFEIFKNIGNLQVKAGDFESAEENYNRAFTRNPQSDSLMVNYGTLEIQRGNLPQAVARFREAVEINPQNDKAWVGLALVHRQFGDMELSWGNLERAMDLVPENETALNLAIEWSLKDGRISQIIDRLENYLMIRDQDAAKSLTLAKILYSTGRLRPAALELERTLLLEPTSSQALTLKSILADEFKRQAERVS